MGMIDCRWMIFRMQRIVDGSSMLFLSDTRGQHPQLVYRAAATGFNDWLVAVLSTVTASKLLYTG